MRKNKTIDQTAARLILATAILASVPLTVSAAALITEIMYDVPGTDTGREWLEIENTGNTAIDVSTWKLFEANTSHKITAMASSSLPSGGFAIIADNPDKFRLDNPHFTGLLFDSAFSLSNEGETLVIRDENGVDVDTVSYLPAWGAGGDGNSLQKSASGVWISAPSTVGLPTVSAVSASALPEAAPSADVVSSTANDVSSHSEQEIANTTYEKADFEITAGRPRLGFVGAPLSFGAKVKTSKNAPIGSSVRSMWSMGDGVQLFGDVISHAYDFAGDYIVIAKSDLNGQRAVAKTSVKIVEPNLVIALLPQFTVEISNPDNSEINVGGFILEDSVRKFVIPGDTIIRAHSSLKFAANLTKIAIPRDFMRLTNPSGKVLRSIAFHSGEVTVELPEGLNTEALKSRIMTALTHAKK